MIESLKKQKQKKKKKKKKMGLVNHAINEDPDSSVCPLKYIDQSLYCMLNTACTIYQRKMYAHADLELQWLLLLFGETRVISVLGS